MISAAMLVRKPPSRPLPFQASAATPPPLKTVSTMNCLPKEDANMYLSVSGFRTHGVSHDVPNG